MYRALDEMLIPVQEVLAYIDEKEAFFSSLGFGIDQMRQDAQNVSHDGSIPGTCLNKIFGPCTSEFLLTQS